MIWTLIVAIIGFVLLHLSLFGRRVFATGGSVVAAEFSGVRTGRIKIWAFILCSLTATLAGLMLAARSSGGNPSLGQGLELDVIAAVIIGGTSLLRRLRLGDWCHLHRDRPVWPSDNGIQHQHPGSD